MYNIITFGGTLYLIQKDNNDIYSGNSFNDNIGILQFGGDVLITNNGISIKTPLSTITLNGVSYNSLTLLRQALSSQLIK